ncbi:MULTISPECIES: hypothetical protein [Mesorhizobium]|uniref:Uncharacterized protein n=1 Tax=Mesorhizobium shonense TaxID=1209948 RepID=A0ABV2HLL5_9HYPH|nr:hypothetical protein [Mesorhizobium sp.]RWB22824.1 MAG: hypothetical protein EOQ40_03740 [Mesorhizobium sp.]RWE04257.1 MAG: hypothetical protein EOS40_00510 [Mesorhizobium sp.]TIS50531.1 MAG: hypothetical protein E5W96_09625 [Mesorhizobium sp.]TIU00364.1 MAG: hypothetical protein E5W55_02880 [Mesorhizobium sp.]
MGLLNMPSPVLSALDNWLTPFLPSSARLVLWAALGAFLCMELYRVLSPQKRIAEIKLAYARTQQSVADFEGEFQEAWPLLRRMLALALRRVALVFPATIAASLPLLLIVVWLDSRYGDVYPPPDASVGVKVSGDFKGRWVNGSNGVPHAQIVDRAGSAIADVPVTQAVSVIQKWRWWNVLIGNPAGYLPDDLPFDRIDLGLPRQQVLGVGPAWLRGWEGIFFAATILVALMLKSVRGIA